MSEPLNLYSDLERRGLIKQVTDPALEKVLNSQSVNLYCGFDPTSDSLHVGNLLPLQTLRRFQMEGHRPIAVVGGATGMIGDPSGKSSERNLLDSEALQKNVEGISKIIEKVLDVSGANAARILNNADWFMDFSYIEFLRDVGKHFTVNHMMTKESVRSRLEDREHGISYTEFSYMLLQSYDFFILNQNERCTLQIGGSDQWGNITAGCELIRRIHAAQGAAPVHVYGLTFPLIMKADGTKFGKSESGAIWLSADRTSPYQFYQYFLRTGDADVMSLIRMLTFLPHGEMDRLEEATLKNPEKREAQKALAAELTRQIHGEKELARAEEASQALFGGDLTRLDGKTLLEVFSEAPSTQRAHVDLGPGVPLVDLLVETGLCPSKGAARKDLTAGGIYINNERVTDPALVVNSNHAIGESYVVLRKGKKNYHLVSFAKTPGA